MNGEMTPGVSAGSNSVGAREKWSAQVIVPSGAASAGAGSASASVSTTPTKRRRDVTAPSGDEDDLERVARPLLEHADGLVHIGEGEAVRDERLGREAPGG